MSRVTQDISDRDEEGEKEGETVWEGDRRVDSLGGVDTCRNKK
jgi:hypothetical protein